jgi:hypothetical protein
VVFSYLYRKEDMAIQLRIDRDRAPAAAVRKHLSKKERKRLLRNGHVVVNLRGAPQQAARTREELGADYVS